MVKKRYIPNFLDTLQIYVILFNSLAYLMWQGHPNLMIPPSSRPFHG